MSSPSSQSIPTGNLQKAIDYLTIDLSTKQKEEVPHVQESLDPSKLKLTSSLLARFEVQGILKVPFKLTDEEEALFLKIVQATKLSTSLFLFEVLCYDLYCQMLSFVHSVHLDDSQRLQKDFKRVWVELQQDPKHDPSKFLPFIDGLPRSYIAGLQRRTTQTVDNSQLQKKNMELRRILETFTCRTKLLRTFLQNPGVHPLIFSSPLSLFAGCEEIENQAVIKTMEPFEQMSKFFTFAYESACVFDPSLENHDLFSFHLETIQHFALPATSLPAEVNTDIIKGIMDWSQSEFLTHIVEALTKGCMAHSAKLRANTARFFTAERTSKMILGQTQGIHDIIPQDKNKDMFVLFKAEGLLPQDFCLASEEDGLLKELFEELPLDSDLTMIDLLSFALNERLKELQKIAPSSLYNHINTIRLEIGAYRFMLYTGLMRLNLSIISCLGPPTDYTSKYHYSPTVFITKLDKQLDELEKLNYPEESKLSRKDKGKTLKEFKKLMANRILPVRNLWVKLLRHPQHGSLLQRAIGMYCGGEHMDRECQEAKGVLREYWVFCETSMEYATQKRLLTLEFSFTSLVDLIRSAEVPSRELMEHLRKLLREIHITLFLGVNNLQGQVEQALLGNLSHEDYLKKNRVVRKSSSKPQQEFVEHICQTWNIASVYLAYAADFLRLCEKRFLPQEALSTESSYFRLLHNLMMYLQQPEAKRAVERKRNFEEIESAFAPLLNFFNSPSFVEFLRFYKTNPDVFSGSFAYATWLEKLIPLEEMVESVYEQTLQELSRLPDRLRKKLKELYQGLSLKELQEIKAEDVREQLFNDCIIFLRHLMILSDILSLLQKKFFYDAAEIIPPELAEVMDLDGIEAILEELIREKTPQIPEATSEPQSIPKIEKESPTVPAPPAELPVPSMESINKPIQQKKKGTFNEETVSSTSSTSSTSATFQEDDDLDALTNMKNISKSVKQKKKGTPKEEPASSSSSMSSTSTTLQEDDAFDEITKLSKSRKILDKLMEMGFFPKRQKGSHTILEGASGGIVVVPKHPEIPLGTRQSIAKQARNASSSKT